MKYFLVALMIVLTGCEDRYRYPDELHALLQFIIGISLCLTLTGTVFAVLYSLIFVVQPIDGQAPNDAEFFKLIAPIATFLTGTLSGIMLGSKSTGDKDGSS